LRLFHKISRRINRSGFTNIQISAELDAASQGLFPEEMEQAEPENPPAIAAISENLEHMAEGFYRQVAETWRA
jgi:hypothetical protein